MQKKGVILLVTVSIIALISVLVLNNLKNINQVIDFKQKQIYHSDIVLISQNITNQIIEQLNKNKENIEEILPLYSLPLDYANIQVIVSYIDFYSKYINLNKYNSSNFNFMNFIEQTKKSSSVTNSKQVSYIISSYLLTQEDKEIEQLKDQFTFFDVGEENYIECKYKFTYDGVVQNVSFLYKLGDSKVKEFEVWN